MYINVRAAANCKDIARTPVTNCEPHCVTLAGYSYGVRRGMKVQLVTPYRVNSLATLRRYVGGNVTVCTNLNKYSVCSKDTMRPIHNTQTPSSP